MLCWASGRKYFGPRDATTNENGAAHMNRRALPHAAPSAEALRCKEVLRVIPGAGRFSDAFSLDGQVYAAMVRSPHPHARIAAIDTARARALPGVLGVFTGADLRSDGLKPIPHDPLPKTRTDLKLTGPGGGPVLIGPHALLLADKARHVGEAVAMVVAQTQAQALDAAEAVAVEYEELPWGADAVAALASGAPALWDEAPGNVLVDTRFGDQAATERAFASADHVVRHQAHIGRVTAVTLEPRAALAVFDPAGDRYTLYAGSGGAVRQKRELAAVLGVAPAQLRVISQDVGDNVGARCVSLSPLGKGSALVTGSYAIPAATLRSRAVFTNTMPTNAYRSSGRPEVTYAIERVIDRAADELGFDRVALRRRNLVRPNAMPYLNAVGAPYDSGQYAANMDLAMRIADWKGFAARRREAKRRGRLLGLGLANYVESSIGAPNERAEITVTAAGRVSVVIGTQIGRAHV